MLGTYNMELAVVRDLILLGLSVVCFRSGEES